MAAAATELTALRTKARSQAALITRLQRMLGDGADRRLVADGASAGGTTGDTVSSAEPRELLDSDARVLALEADLSRAEGRIDDRDRTIAALKQDLADYEARADAAMADRESSRDERSRAREDAVAKARESNREMVGKLEGTIQQLRSELAAANERLAKQAAQFQNEYRRLGGRGTTGQPRHVQNGTGRPVSSNGREASGNDRATGATGVRPSAKPPTAKPKAPASDADAQKPAARPSLVDRIGERLARVDAETATQSASRPDASVTTSKRRLGRTSASPGLSLGARLRGSGAGEQEPTQSGDRDANGAASPKAASKASVTSHVASGLEHSGSPVAGHGRQPARAEIVQETPADATGPGTDADGETPALTPSRVVAAKRRRGLLARISDMDDPVDN
ncbi:MAG: hypothetical protein AAFY64_06065 [Pseudomonadota bacterium]